MNAKAKDSFINILIAEDNDVSRELMAAALRTQGFQVFGAVDGESAIKVVEDRHIDLALIDVNMAPKGGLEFVKHLVVKGIDVPVVIVTGDESSHILIEATQLGVSRVVQKPIDIEKLLQIVARILKRRGHNLDARVGASVETKFSHEEIMKKAIALADKNAKSKHGGPFGAIVADAEGKILGEGVNGITSRVDPTAHAEVMAIRRAVDKLGQADLSACVLYSAAEPTAMGQALIASVGIKKVYYGLSGDEVRSIRSGAPAKPEYIKLGHDDALKAFKDWQAQKEKVAD